MVLIGYASINLFFIHYLISLLLPHGFLLRRTFCFFISNRNEGRGRDQHGYPSRLDHKASIPSKNVRYKVAIKMARSFSTNWWVRDFGLDPGTRKKAGTNLQLLCCTWLFNLLLPIFLFMAAAYDCFQCCSLLPNGYTRCLQYPEPTPLSRRSGISTLQSCRILPFVLATVMDIYFATSVLYHISHIFC